MPLTEWMQPTDHLTFSKNDYRPKMREHADIAGQVDDTDVFGFGCCLYEA